MKNTPLKFNIIYIAGTVNYLSLFVFSLLKWSNCSFRLISNGCQPEERKLLKCLCMTNSRLEYLEIPSETGIKHGKALAYLQSIEEGDYFCFLDSDIFATHDFLSELFILAEKHFAVFSCSPIWFATEEQSLPDFHPRMPGHFNKADNGVCLGTTYFAIYENKTLTQFLQKTGLHFDKYNWQEIPDQYKAQLEEMGLKKQIYDTAKVLNLIIQTEGQQIIVHDTSALCHIGGISAVYASDNKLLSKTNILRNWIRKISHSIFSRQFQKDALKRRAETSRYFTSVLQSLFEGAELPPLMEISNPDIRKRIQSATKDMVGVYEEFGEDLRKVRSAAQTV